jgi:hypothetical protein
LGQLDHPWAISNKLYDHWKLALLFYFGSGIALAIFSILYPSPSFSVNLTANLVLALAFIPGFIYILSEFARLADAPDSSSKTAVRTMIIGFIAFFGFGVAIPHSYTIALDAFNLSLPSDPSLRLLLITGDLSGQFAMGLATVFARKIGPFNIPQEPEKPQSMRDWLGEGLEIFGLIMIGIGFLVGIGVFALAAFFLIVAGTILIPIGYIIRKFWH